MGKLACSGRKAREEQQPACTGSTGIFGFAQDLGDVGARARVYIVFTSGIINNLAIIQLSYTVRISEVGTVAGDGADRTEVRYIR